ncbi:MAG: hypothetical protein NWQ07_04300 [Flaviramulus sp.]|nr:hypothetical protein [Flaviramulus sp.]
MKIEKAIFGNKLDMVGYWFELWRCFFSGTIAPSGIYEFNNTLALGYRNGNVTFGIRYHVLNDDQKSIRIDHWIPFVRFYF